ncbi:MAG TPA: flagellar export chaperone FlgN [Pirellulales bacterium]|nr:flagellar export chaperone FlgN [Pirellulales bacterium]
MIDHSWEEDITALLNELTATQADLLALLDEKRRFIVSRDAAGLAEMGPREEAMIERLHACQDHRRELLQRAASQRLPSDSLRALAKVVPEPARGEIAEHVDETARRFRLLSHHSLANWVLIQRSLLHLSQLLEIIATGGRKNPTYGKVEQGRSGGSLLDQAA